MKAGILFSVLLAVASFANAETYKVDTGASQITWKGTKVTGGHHGTIGLKSGSVELTKGALTGGQFVADMSTLTSKDLAGDPGSQAKLDGHLKSADFFNVAKHPESSFTITKVTSKSASEATVEGDLTFNGKTGKISFPAKITQGKGTVTGEATVKIDRTKWDLKYGSGQFFKGLGDKMIHDEFELGLKLIAKK